MSDVAIRCEGLGKRYRIGARPRYKALRDTLAGALSAPFRRAASLLPGSTHQPANAEDTIWALKDVSFEVKRGEVVGIIGRNGAGKTTLLKILSRITEPTTGRAEIYGRIASLLEVGTGFHPELTGRENIYLNGAILGMRKAEIDRRLDEIVAFSEVEKFIDTPVKHFSSGMYVRLAFAVAAHLEPEILLVDEVLAVGDAAFQKKCLGKMADVAGHGRTVLFVSHNTGAISRMCDTSVWLSHGSVAMAGRSVEVVRQYESRDLAACAEWRRTSDHNGDNEVAFLHVLVKRPGRGPTEVFNADWPIVVEMGYAVRRPLSGCQIGARLYSSNGIVVFTTSDADSFGVSAQPKEAGLYRASFTIPEHLLAPDTYCLLVAAHLPNRVTYEVIERAVVFEVGSSGSLASLDGRLGVIAPLLPWDTSGDPAG